MIMNNTWAHYKKRQQRLTEKREEKRSYIHTKELSVCQCLSWQSAAAGFVPMKVEGLTGGPFFLTCLNSSQINNSPFFACLMMTRLRATTQLEGFFFQKRSLFRVEWLCLLLSPSPHNIHHWLFNDEGKFICIRTLSFWIIITIEY